MPAPLKITTIQCYTCPLLLLAIFLSPQEVKVLRAGQKKINTKVKMDRFFIGIKKTSHRSIKH